MLLGSQDDDGRRSGPSEGLTLSLKCLLRRPPNGWKPERCESDILLLGDRDDEGAAFVRGMWRMMQSRVRVRNRSRLETCSGQSLSRVSRAK